MKLKLLPLLGIIVGALAPLCAQTSLASHIEGIVVDEEGPVIGSTIYYHTRSQMKSGRMGVPTPSGPSITGSVVSASNGAFSIPDLTPETYYLCAQGVKANAIASCGWSGGEVPVTVAAGQSNEGVKLSLQSGIIVTINVSDPNNRIVDGADSSGGNSLIPLPGANFSVGVMSGIAFGRASLSSQLPGLRIYLVTVPADAPIRLLVSTTLGVSDSPGSAIKAGVPGQPIDIAPTGSNSISITVQ